MHFLFNVFFNNRDFMFNNDWSVFCFSVNNDLNGLLDHFFDDDFSLSGSVVSWTSFFLLRFGLVNTFSTLIFARFAFLGLFLWFALFLSTFIGGS